MLFSVVTIFPEMLNSVFRQGVVGKAIESDLVQLRTWNPRDFTRDVHRTVDDRPFGGGPGMLMKIEPVVAALTAAKKDFSAYCGEKTGRSSTPRCVYLSPQGKPINQRLLREVATWSGVVMLCGRYEGVDERVIESEIDQEWSLGDFVLSGGEIAAAAVIDGVARLLPGVLGHAGSAAADSFENGLLDCPHYTRPETYCGQKVPAVLLSGNHEQIKRWRLEQSVRRTIERRPDLLEGALLSEPARKILRDLKFDRKT